LIVNLQSLSSLPAANATDQKQTFAALPTSLVLYQYHKDITDFQVDLENGIQPKSGTSLSELTLSLVSLILIFGL
jgi:hypothetical protein